MVTALQPIQQQERKARTSSQPMLQAVNAPIAPALGTSPADWLRDNRIHIKDGSRFVDGYLVVHPRELDPANEAKLREKLALTYSLNNPSFYESPERLGVALNLAQLLPISLNAKHSKLMGEIEKFNAQVDSGTDATLVKQEHDRRQPFAAIVHDTLEKPSRDPEGMETLKNGVAMYLLVRGRMTQLGFLDSLASYVPHHQTPDQVLGDVSDKLGLTPQQIREAAQKGGLEGVGAALGLNAAYVQEVKQVAEQTATKDFSANLVENWHLGQQLLHGQPTSLEQKMATGLEARITSSIGKLRSKAHQHFDVPEPIKAEEKRIAEVLNLVEPIQRALMHKLGYEICFTPEVTADSIAKHQGIYGLHRKAANDQRDVAGTYRIYFSGRGDLKGSMRTLVHEVAHNLWPAEFSSEAVQKIDALAANDADRFAKLNRLVDEKFPEFERFLKAYQAGNDAEKAAIATSAREYFKPYGVNVDEGVLPYLRDANDFKYLVKHVHATLSVEGERYAKSGYNSPNARFREVISRFAELKQVELRGEPQLMQFLAPNLNQIWETHYLPHLEKVYQGVVSRQSSVVSKEESPAAIAPTVPPQPNAPQPSIALDGTQQHQGFLGNERTLAAMNTLNAMGIGAGR